MFWGSMRRWTGYSSAKLRKNCGGEFLDADVNWNQGKGVCSLPQIGIKMKSLFLKIVLCVICMEILGVLGAIVTVGSIDTWYSTLTKPPGTPPNWLFGPVWSVLYALIGISLAIIWHRADDSATRSACFKVFMVQLVLNLAWTPVFFGAHQMAAALFIIVAMLFFIVLTILHFRKVSVSAAMLLVPYLIWVSYATYLNAGYLVLNLRSA